MTMTFRWALVGVMSAMLGLAAVMPASAAVSQRWLCELEDEMCDFGLDGLSSGASPDRLDALVWALTDLMLNQGGQPRARHL